MRKILPILLLFPLLLGGCQWIDQQIPSEEDLLEKELQQINWSEVDEYPSVVSCDSLTDKEQKKQCFFQYLTELIQIKLSADTLAVQYPQLDTIEVKVTVLPNATLEFEPQLADSLALHRPVIDSIIKTRLVDFPEIQPALKRGMPVKTQFVLPVILDVQKSKFRRR
ncbi:hypothetical protein [Flavobacterium caeni]|uniref:TonB protein C-terminal n=1 Tax=Flavobacterium caeni TaxID=490189 RepID=A0A1G5GE43_9FLAO|nr:hypothetical protein [Flavobacterium caeni]SCY49520.1 hypothetical protein SAMN02927903_01534 [Flavobacterium caeni]